MGCIRIVKDNDFGLDEKEFNNPFIRLGARGIIVRDDGKIAVFYKSKMNEYKLPGGGIENDEKPELAFMREAMEETGCEIEDIKPLGMIEEHKSQTNFKQISYVFVSKVKKDTKNLSLTEKEQGEGAMLLWLSPTDALEKIANCLEKLKASPVDEAESLYSTKFVVLRDKSILEYYIKRK